MALTKETPEAKSWIYDILKEAGIRLPTIEGYSVKGDKVTALFERFKSIVDVEKWSTEDILKLLLKDENKGDWADRTVLASALRVPLYLVLWRDGQEKFRILSVVVKNKMKMGIHDEKLFDSCKDLATWMSELKGIQVSKRFIEPGRLASIDQCLRLYGVPWPGNLDGFLLDSRTQAVNVIFEFSRTRKFPVRTHNLNLYFSQDINRWKPLDILRKELNVPLYIVIWSSEEKLTKIHCLRRIAEKGLEFDKTELVEKEHIVSWFGQFLQP
jgi:hypothetical protein